MRHVLPGWKLISAFVATWAVASVAGGQPSARPPAASARPRLAVIVAVDGLTAPRLERYRPWFAAGLRRLLEQGTVYAECRYRHINTETSPGHASLATGAPPRVHGIVGNKWYEAAPDGSWLPVSATWQPPAKATGARTKGPDHLRVPTLGDRLAASFPEARVVTVSGKDRGALFLAGRVRSHAAYWFDRRTGTFITSPVYVTADGPARAAAEAMASFNATHAGARLEARLAGLWRPLPPRPGAPPGPAPYPAERLLGYQVPVNGLGFPHDLTANVSGLFTYPSAFEGDDPAAIAAGDRGYFSGVYRSPLVDELVADAALALLADERLALGLDPTPDLLALSFSAQDTVSHDYGPDSEENLDVLRRLDVQLGRVLEALDERVGAGAWVIALSADHGFNSIPEYERVWNGARDGGRLVDSVRSAANVVSRLNDALAAEPCTGTAVPLIAATEGWNVYYNRKVLPARVTGGGGCPGGSGLVGAREIDEALPRVAMRLLGRELEGVYVTAEADRWPPSSPLTELVRNDFVRERSGDAFLLPRPGVIIHEDPGRGTGHGSHHEADTRVPLVFLGAAFAAERRTPAVTPYDLAPTLAAALGVALPDAAGASLLPAGAAWTR